MKGMTFNADSVRALLAGQKTETRRVIKPQPHCEINPRRGLGIHCYWRKQDTDPLTVWTVGAAVPDSIIAHARYAVGDIVWVRETWARVYKYEDCIANEFDDRPRQCADCDGCTIEYKADTGNKYPGDWPDDMGDDPSCGRWHSPTNMWKYMARIRLRITDVRAERVQEITEDDALAEGIRLYEWVEQEAGYNARYGDSALGCWPTARDAYAALWDSIYAKRGYRWADNPWAWRYVFEQVEKPEEAK